MAAARQRNMAPLALLVFAAAVVGAAFAGLWLVHTVRLPFHSNSGIVAWVTHHRYAKSQEIFNLAVAVVGLLGSLLAAWWTWILGAAWGAGFSRCAPSRLLKPLALPSVAMLALAPRLAQLKVTSLHPLILALSGVALAGFLLLLWHRRRGASHACPERDTTTEELPAPTPVRPRRFLIVLRRILVWFVLPVLVYCLSFDNRLDGGLGAFNQFHEGERLYPMVVMQHGGLPYRDAYLQHGLFRNALAPHLGATLFSPTLEGMRRLDDILWPLGALSLYLVGATLLASRPLPLLFLALFLLSARVEIPERVFFAALAAALMAAAVRRSGLFGLLHPSPRSKRATAPLLSLARFARQEWRLLLSGVLAALAFWTSVDMGLFATAGLGAFLMIVAVLAPHGDLRARVRPMLAFGAGVLAGLGAVAAYFAWHGALYEVLRNTYQQCAYQNETWGLPFPDLADLAPPRDESGGLAWSHTLQRDVVQMYLPFVCLLLAEVGLVWLWLHGRLWTSRRGWALLLVTCVGLFFARGLLGRSDIYHLYAGLVSQILLATLALDAALGFLWKRMTALPAEWRRRRLWPLASWLGAIVLLGFAGQLFADSYEPLQSLKRRAPAAFEDLAMTLSGPPTAQEPFPGAGRITLGENEAEHARRLVRFIRDNTQPGEPILNFSSFPMPMTFADRPSASRYFIPCYATTPAMQREAIAEIDRRQPRLAYRGVGHDFDGVLTAERQHLMQEYLEAHYEPLGRDEDLEFLWRKDAGPRPIPRDLQITVDAQRDYHIESVSAGKCVQFADAPSAQGGVAHIQTCDQSDAQSFRFDPQPDGAYQIRLAGTEKCLDIEAWSKNDGTAVKGFHCHNGSNQQWRIVGVDAQTVRLMAQHSGKGLDVWFNATTDGTPLKQVRWKGSRNQQFRLRARAESAPEPQ